MSKKKAFLDEEIEIKVSFKVLITALLVSLILIAGLSVLDNISAKGEIKALSGQIKENAKRIAGNEVGIRDNKIMVKDIVVIKNKKPRWFKNEKET